MSAIADATSLAALIESQGTKIRELKTAKAAVDVIKAEVNELLNLKNKYKEVVGSDYAAPGGAPVAAPAPKKKEAPGAAPADPKKAAKKEEQAAVKPAAPQAVQAKEEVADLSGRTLYTGSTCDADDVLRCVAVGELCGKPLKIIQQAPASVAVRIPFYPAIVVASTSSSGQNKQGTVIFGAVAVCRYLALDCAEVSASGADLLVQESLLDLVESMQWGADAAAVLSKLEAGHATLSKIPLVQYVLYPSLKRALSASAIASAHPQLHALVQALSVSTAVAAATATIASSASTSGTSSKANKATKKAAAASNAATSTASSTVFSNDDVVKPVLGHIDWASAGLMSSLNIVFEAAILAAFPQSVAMQLSDAVITRCANPAFGDFQCNNAMALSKGLKGLVAEGYAGPVSPKDVAERIIAAIPVNPIVSSTSSAPNGFINITLSGATLTSCIASIIQQGVQPPVLPRTQVLVDFSSPNIAKEMHVGHLRSTIIGDAVCRLLEFCKYDVLRVNHVGDWGTQFGMLITYLQEAFPDILTNPPNISDLTVIYKASKKRFDEDPAFKELSRLNVVRLQAHDPSCTAIWKLLCDISRLEFQKVYDALDVKLTEVGESFYNPMIPSTIEELQALNMVVLDEGMLCTKLPHFTIPLILRKSDGGYGYDSTDMAALKYRTATLKRDWLIYITDAGQAPHFHMCFDAAKEAKWLPAHRVDHIGFGVVCGEDGKRFKTRSSETVRLIDLLDAAKDRMRESLRVRAEEGKSALQGEDLERAARIIGYGAVKYFDLKQNPGTNYIFNYDRMLDTKGDTAVYLLFAYARLASILRKAAEERNLDMAPLHAQAHTLLSLTHPAERALAFELLQLGDVIKGVIQDLLPNRLCDYLHHLSVSFTDFVTKCHVLNADSADTVHSRLLLCEATRRVMAQCFQLLGIGTLERI